MKKITKPIRVVIADDHLLVRRGIRALLEAEPDIDVVGEAGNGTEAVEITQQLNPDVLLLDLMMPALHGLDAARKLSERTSTTEIVILSMYGNELSVPVALRDGAAGFVAKDAPPSELLAAIRCAAKGRSLVSQSLSGFSTATSASDSGAEDPYLCLTPREREVLTLVAEGRSSASIGEVLSLSTRTVETHRANVMRKLSLRDHTALVKYAIARGIVQAGWYPGPVRNAAD